MTCTYSKKQIALAVSCALTLGVLSFTASAATDPADTAYLTDSRGAAVKSGSGLCWHTNYGPSTTNSECDAAPAVVAKAAEPAAKPVAAVTPAPVAAARPTGGKVTLDADALFDFDKAVLRPAGRAALDDFVTKSKEMNPEVIMAVGHTDRLGSDAYNQRLSEQRVAAVRTYLLSRGIASDRLHTEGKGETQPITKADECKGPKSAKVIACLQPDRRVDIEVIGTK